MGLAVLFKHRRDAEVTQHQFRVFIIAKEEVTGFNVLVQYIVVMTVSQGSGSLQGNASELAEVVAQSVLVERAALQILHQLEIAMLSVHIGLAEVVDPYNHLEVKRVNDLQQLLVNIKVGIVHLQHILFVFTTHQEHLSLARTVAQALHLVKLATVQHEHIILLLFLL